MAFDTFESFLVAAGAKLGALACRRLAAALLGWLRGRAPAPRRGGARGGAGSEQPPLAAVAQKGPVATRARGQKALEASAN